MPRRARRKCASRLMSASSSSTDPGLVAMVPATHAARVDLPAPFGPRMAQMLPAGTSNVTSRSASSPP